VHIPQEAMQDPWEKNEPGLGLSRDPSRTPFQWDATANAGFSRVQPWLPLDPSYKTRNVAALRPDPLSILNLYRRLLSVRRQYAALNSGSFQLIGAQGNALVYERRAGSERIVVCLNLGDAEQPIGPQDFGGSTILISTHPERTALDSNLVLRPNEGLTILMAS
jgi:alpha-glucosidase